MIKRKPQEIADFFGCYVAMNESGCWHIFPKEPKKSNRYWRGGGNKGFLGALDAPIDLVDTPANHNWTTLYEPAIKEKVKKLVPFDLSKKEDRDALRGKWVVDSDGGEHLINAFYPTREVCNGIYLTMRTNCGNGIILFENYTFLDGSPVGKEVEE